MTDDPDVAPKRRRRRRTARPAPAADASVVVGSFVSDSSGLAPILGAASLAAATAGHLIGDGALVLGGLATGLGLFGLVKQQNLMRITLIEIDPRVSQVRFVSSGGRAVSVAAASIASFEVTRHAQSRSTSDSGSGSDTQTATYRYRLVARKSDGGVLETIELSKDDEAVANARAAELNEALAAARSAVPSAETADPLAELQRSAAFAIEAASPAPAGYRAGPRREALTIRWPGREPVSRFLAGLGVLGGMSLFFASFGSGKGGDSLVYASYFMALCAALVLFGFVTSYASRITVRVDDAGLSLEHQRFSFWVTRRAWPLEEIRAVDLSVSASSMTLVVRADDAPTVDDVARKGDLAGVIEAAWARAGDLIPLGSLDVVDAIQLDQALSDAIAQRRGDAAAAV